MRIQLVEITVKRDRGRLGPEISRRVVGELPDDPLYTRKLCEFLIDKMVKEGIIPAPGRPKETVQGED